MSINNHSECIDYFSLNHPLIKLKSHFSYKARKKIFSLFMELIKPGPDTSVIDLGVTPDNSQKDSNFFEKLYPYKDKIIAAGIEDASFLASEFPGVKFMKIEAAGRLPFNDNEFDVLFCSAVLEHVGQREKQAEFIGECARIAKRFFITTPDRRFPIEFHTILPLIHWLPQALHQQILRRLGMDFWSHTENLNLLTPAELSRMMPDCKMVKITNVKLFAIPSNVIVYGES